MSRSNIIEWTVTVDTGDSIQEHTVHGHAQYKEGPWIAFLVRDGEISRVAAIFSAHRVISVIAANKGMA